MSIDLFSLVYRLIIATAWEVLLQRISRRVEYPSSSLARSELCLFFYGWLQRAVQRLRSEEKIWEILEYKKQRCKLSSHSLKEALQALPVVLQISRCGSCLNYNVVLCLISCCTVKSSENPCCFVTYKNFSLMQAEAFSNQITARTLNEVALKDVIVPNNTNICTHG